MQGRLPEVTLEGWDHGSTLLERPSCQWHARAAHTQLRTHLTQLFRDLQQQRQHESNHEPVQFHSHATVPVDVAGTSRKHGEVQGSN